MAYEQRDNSGSLFKNDRKTSESHPNAKGSAMIDGVEYWVSAWTKKDKNGNAWQSLSFEPKDKDARASKPQPRAKSNSIDDDVPFF
jgi:hypothetical protein